MQSPEKPSSTSTKDSQQKNEGPPKQKQGSRPKFLSGIISAGYIKTEMGQNVSLASGVVLGLVFSCICLLVWTEKADQISPTINLVFIISLIAYNVLSFLKPVNVSIGTVSLRSHITVACCLLNPILIGMVAVFAQNVNVCLALSFNLLNGLKVMPLTGILCRVVITTVVVVLYEKELLMRIAIVCTNTDIVIQFVWVSFLLRRPLKKSPVCKPPTQKLNQKTLKMKILAGARNTRKLEVEDKASIAENLSQSELAEEAPFKIPQSVPKLSLPNLDSSRSDRGPTDRIPIQSAGRQVGQSLEAPRRVSSIQVEMDGPKKDEPSKRDIQYQINIPHQPTDSYRAVPVMQSDPEADTVKGKKSKDYAHGSPRIPKSPTKNQPLTKASSFIVQPEKTPINRVNSFTPANMNPDLLGGQQYMSPSLLSVVPKSSDRKDLSAMMAGLTPSNEISQTSDALKSRVYGEWFEMIDELVLIGDKKLSVIANNFNNNVEARTIKKMSKQFEREILRQKNAPLTLDAYFKSTNPDKGVHMSCSEETLRSLRTIYEAFNYRQTKVSDRDRYEKLKIANILANLEEMTSQLRSQQRAKTGRIREMGGEIVNMTKSTRNIRVGNVTDCRYTIPEVLFLIREYLRVIHGKTLKYHFSNTLIFTFFFQEKTQCKIRLVSVDSTFYLLMLVENISDKVELGELNSKLNYSHMLMKSLSNELKTPVHQVIQVLQELELLLEARATTDPPLLRTIAKFQQIAGGLDITVGNILDYASILNKTIQLKKTKFLLKAFLDELVCCFQEKCKLKKISVQVECDPELIMCTDYNRLRG